MITIKAARLLREQIVLCGAVASQPERTAEEDMMSGNFARIASALVFVFATVGISEAGTDLTLIGTWKIHVRCRTLDYINIVNIGTANTRHILGTTNVGDAYGKIVSGYLDGRTFEFKNTYLWEGKRHQEIWKGTLSQSGKSLKGTFVSNGAYEGENNCRYTGSRL